MADNTEQEGEYLDEQMEINLDEQMEIKVEPTLQGADVGTLNLWTSKATACLINQYKKYHSMVGQSTQIRSLRGMFETISLEMQKHGFYFSPQKCENKWRVLERKYKNLVSRELLKKPGRVRHYGQWEHKRALDEIFKEKKRHMYFQKSDFPSQAGRARYMFILPKPINEEQSNITVVNQQQEIPLAAPSSNSSANNKNELTDQKESPTFFNKFLEEIAKYFAIAEKNREKRHKEEMAIRQSELEIQKRLLKLKEQKIELQKRQIIAAAQYLHLNM